MNLHVLIFCMVQLFSDGFGHLFVVSTRYSMIVPFSAGAENTYKFLF